MNRGQRLGHRQLCEALHRSCQVLFVGRGIRVILDGEPVDHDLVVGLSSRKDTHFILGHVEVLVLILDWFQGGLRGPLLR